MLTFFTSAAFKYFMFPLFGAALGIFVKHATRNDQYAKFRKEDVAVGLDLLKTACLTLLVFATDKSAALVTSNNSLEAAITANVANAQLAVLQKANTALLRQVTDAWIIIVLMIIGLWSLSTLVRKLGWKNETEQHGMLGIAIPLSVGILSLVLVMAKATT